MSDYQDSIRKALNDKSRNAATANREVWGADEEALLMTWDGSDDELTLMAELLERTREACRERFYVLRRGERPSSVVVTRITSTSTSTTATYRYADWADADDWNQEWYR